MSLRLAPSLTDQVYDAVVDEISDGRLAAGTHIVQEQLAARLGVSRQPVQQAMARLRADGMVEELGKRGLFVARLDPGRMLQHYGVRAALDGYAARIAAGRAQAEPRFAAAFKRAAGEVLKAGAAAVADYAIAEQIRLDAALHALIYDHTGNPMIAAAAEPHWRFLRRAMGDVLRQAERPAEIWRQHRAIIAAIVAGDPPEAERLALAHVERAAERLARAIATEAA
jgi:DNA-binding GntR family transcriptional regulator